MKKSYLLFIISFFVFQLSSIAQEKTVQKQTPPSDIPGGYTYDFDKTQNLIVDRLTNPTEFNKDVEVFISDSKFPTYKKGTVIDAAFRQQISEWMEKNPDMIINTLKHRTDIVRSF